MRRHVQIIVDRNVKALVADPAQVERLALDGTDDHLGKLVEHVKLHVCVECGVVENRLGDHGERQVTAVDGKTGALGKVHAGLAATNLPVVGDVVVDECARLKVLDGRRGAAGAFEASAHRGGGEHADERAVAFAGVGRKGRKWCVQVALDIGGSRLSVKERGQIVVNLVKVLG